jgi:hypothetical protein
MPLRRPRGLSDRSTDDRNVHPPTAVLIACCARPGDHLKASIVKSDGLSGHPDTRRYGGPMYSAPAARMSPTRASIVTSSARAGRANTTNLCSTAHLHVDGADGAQPHGPSASSFDLRRRGRRMPGHMSIGRCQVASRLQKAGQMHARMAEECPPAGRVEGPRSSPWLPRERGRRPELDRNCSGRRRTTRSDDGFSPPQATCRGHRHFRGAARRQPRHDRPTPSPPITADVGDGSRDPLRWYCSRLSSTNCLRTYGSSTSPN